MFCEKCNDSYYAQALSIGKCKVCKKDIPTPHMPSYSICKECANTYNLCEQCGCRLDEGEPSHQL